MPVETFTAQIESIKNLTQDVRRFDLRLIEPRTIDLGPSRFVSWRRMVQMIDAVLDIAMMRRCHLRRAGREHPTAE